MDTESIFPFLIILFPIIIIIIFILKLLKSPSPKLPLPPGPKPWPLLGNLHHIGANPLPAITRFSAVHGPLISLRLGTQLAVFASSPATAAQILRTHDRTFSSRYIFDVATYSDVHCLFSLSLSPECDDHWKLLRTTCRTHLFSPKAMESQTLARNSNVMALIDYLESKTGEVVEIVDVGFTTVFNILSNVIVSKRLLEFEGDGAFGFKKHYKNMIELGLVPNLADFYPILSRFDLQGLKKRMAKFACHVDCVYDGFIEERKRDRDRDRNGNGRPGDFLDSMLDLGFCDRQIRLLISEMLTTGTDTTSTTVEWAMAELVKNKHVMEKVQEEIRRETKDRNATIDESIIPRLHYLQACVKETLRLHPPAPFLLPHRALHTCEVMGYTIPKDTRIFVNTWAIGRDPTVWENHSTFNPNRFLESDIDYKGFDFRYLPFGSGRRICPGYPMGLEIVNLILATLIRNFDWSLPNDEDPSKLDLTGKMGITYHKVKPLSLIPKKKQASFIACNELKDE